MGDTRCENCDAVITGAVSIYLYQGRYLCHRCYVYATAPNSSPDFNFGNWKLQYDWLEAQGELSRLRAENERRGMRRGRSTSAGSGR